MSLRPFFAPLCRALALVLLGGALAGPAAAADEVRVYAQAERIEPDGTQREVALPHHAKYRPEGLTLRWQIDADPAPRQQALYLPGLVAHGRLTLNGQVLLDRSEHAAEELPPDADCVVLLVVPDAFWRAGRNFVELHADGRPGMSISRLSVGPVAALVQQQRARLFGLTVGPMIISAVIGAMGLCVAALWARLRDPLLGYFALAAVLWALHTAWTALPVATLSRVHFIVWWNSLYMFVVAMLVLFCLRFADWHWPRVERVVWCAALAGPLLLYGAEAAGALVAVARGWRLLWILSVLLGVAAVAHTAWRRRDLDSLLITLTGLIALALGVRDWLGDPSDNNRVMLVHYAGLPFIGVVTTMLIKRYLGAAAELERMNRGLERRVAEQNAELRQTVEQMRAARDAAEAADRAKSSFLAAASHDLRQPAHALGLYLAALQAQPLAPPQTELVERMSSSLDALDLLFSALLDVSRIDAGAVVPKPRTLALAPLLRRLADEFAPQAEARGLRLSLRLPPQRPGNGGARVDSDPLLLERILRNLLANAIKYTRTGGVLLACRARHDATGRICWRLEVWDSGIGIAPADQALVFDEFVQVGNPGRDRQAGLGLGLSIVRRLARLLDAPVTLRSRPGHGSAFMLSLPTSQALPGVEPATAPATPRAAGAALDGMVVAMLEDDAEVRAALAGLLTQWGCRVAAGADAGELLAALGHETRAPQAIVADYRLREGRTGPAELQSLFDHWGGAVPALMITGESSASALRDIDAAGHPFLAKPLAPERLRQWLAQVARRIAPQGA